MVSYVLRITVVPGSTADSYNLTTSLQLKQRANCWMLHNIVHVIYLSYLFTIQVSKLVLEE